MNIIQLIFRLLLMVLLCTGCARKQSISQRHQPHPDSLKENKPFIFWSDTFLNGLAVFGEKNPASSFVQVRISVRTGISETGNENMASCLPGMMISMLNQSTRFHSREELALKLEKLKASIQVANGLSEISFTLKAPPENLDSVLKILEEKMFYPRFLPDEFQKVKQDFLVQAEKREMNFEEKKEDIFRKILYADHPLAISWEGSKQEILNVSLDNCIAYYHNAWIPSRSRVTVCGKITREQFMVKAKFLGIWRLYDMLPVVEKQVNYPKSIHHRDIFFISSESSDSIALKIGWVITDPAPGNFNWENEFSGRFLVQYLRDSLCPVRDCVKDENYFPGNSRWPFAVVLNLKAGKNESEFILQKLTGLLKNIPIQEMDQKRLDTIRGQLLREIESCSPDEACCLDRVDVVQDNYFKKENSFVPQMNTADIDNFIRKNIQEAACVILLSGEKKALDKVRIPANFRRIEPNREGIKDDGAK